MQPFFFFLEGLKKITKDIRVDDDVYDEIFFSLCQLLIATTYLIRIESFNLRIYEYYGRTVYFFLFFCFHPSVNVKAEREKKNL